MASFVLVPGAMHGKWAWDRVRPHLERAGYQVIAEDLPGVASKAGTPPVGSVTLDVWADFVADLVRRADAPTILVGHSRGGLVIGAAAERVHDRLAGLIYVTALLVPPGMSGLEASGAAPAQQNSASQTIGMLEPPVTRALLYHRCTAEDAEWAAARVCAEPMRPLSTPTSASWDGWGRVPRAFLACSDDRLLTPERQQAMLDAVPCDPVVTLDSDHSPFLCMPKELAETMVDVARTFERRTQVAH